MESFEAEEAMTKEHALAFQSHVIVLFMMCNGGQRKQVTTLFIYKLMKWSEQYKCYLYTPLVEKKQRALTAEGISLVFLY